MKKFAIILSAVVAVALLATLAVPIPQRYEGSSSLQRILEPIVRDQADWIDDLELHAQMPDGRVVIGDYLFGIGQNPGNLGVVAWDGTTCRQGGKSNDSIGRLWTDGTRLYGGRNGSLVTVTYGSLSGAFTQGEAVTQEAGGTDPTGWFIRDDGTNLYIQKAVGSTAWTEHATTSTVTGGDSGETAEALTTVTDTLCMFLQVSTTGFTDFKTVQEFQDRLYSRSFINCGTIGGSQLLLCIEVREAEAQTTSIWWNRPGTNDDWTLLDTSLANSFRHCHGGVVVTNVNGGTVDRLILFTGDTDTQASIVICNDIADLLANSGDWMTNWGWDQVAGAAKTAFLTSGAGTPYSYGVGSQLYRALDIVVDEDERFGYYIPDTSTAALLKLAKLDLVDGSIAQPGMAQTTNEGSIGLRLSNNAIVLSTFGGGGGIETDYLELWVVTETGDDMKRLWARPIAGSSISRFTEIVEFPVGDTAVEGTNAIWCSGGEFSSPELIGNSAVGRMYPRGEGSQRFLSNSGMSPVRSPIINLIANGRFRRGWATAAWTRETQWIAGINVTHTKETSEVDDVGGNDIVLKQTPDGGGLAYTGQKLIPEDLDLIRGNWVTLRVRVLHPTSTANVPSVRIIMGGSYDTLIAPVIAESDDWQTVELVTFVPLDIASFDVRLQSSLTGGGTDPVYFSDARVVVGAYPGQLPGNMLARDSMNEKIHSGPNAPVRVYSGLMWFETDTDKLQMWSSEKGGGAGWETVIDFSP